MSVAMLVIKHFHERCYILSTDLGFMLFNIAPVLWSSFEHCDPYTTSKKASAHLDLCPPQALGHMRDRDTAQWPSYTKQDSLSFTVGQ